MKHGRMQGSVFVEFADFSSVDAFLNADPKPSWNGEDLLIMTKCDISRFLYHELVPKANPVVQGGLLQQENRGEGPHWQGSGPAQSERVFFASWTWKRLQRIHVCICLICLNPLNQSA
jgi:hypothetical protein